MSWNQWATVMSLLAKTLEGKSDKFPYVITESSPCPYRIEDFLLL